MADLQKYFPLVAPAVSLLLLLVTRQSRISVIARDNAKQILEAKRRNRNQDRAENLLNQNKKLLQRYYLIQLALIVLCIALFGLVILTFHEYFYGDNRILFWVAVVVMGFGTSIVLLEIATGADTLRYEIEFADWYKSNSQAAKESAPQIINFTVFKWWKRSRELDKSSETERVDSDIK
jgi:membrane protein required for beta-lactamase induction